MIYIIFKDKHYSDERKLKLHSGIRDLSFHFIFHKNCWYDYKDDNSWDINKLYGYSLGYHKKNSIRIGWRPDFYIKNKIDLFVFTHNDGVISFDEIGSVWTDKMNYIKISNYKTIYKVYFNGEEKWSGIFNHCRFGYMLYPYFGGNNKAPQTMEIEII